MAELSAFDSILDNVTTDQAEEWQAAMKSRSYCLELLDLPAGDRRVEAMIDKLEERFEALLDSRCVKKVELELSGMQVTLFAPSEKGDNGNQYLIHITGLRPHLATESIDNQWCVIVGDWEFDEFVRCSGKLAKKIREYSTSKNLTSSRHLTSRGAVTLTRALWSSVWTLHLEFNQQPFCSNGYNHRWHLYPETTERTIDLLEMFSRLDPLQGDWAIDMDKRRDWCLPEGDISQITQECQRRLAVSDKGMPEPVSTVLGCYYKSLLEGVATCPACQTLFERGRDESWKKLCLACYIKGKRPA